MPFQWDPKQPPFSFTIDGQSSRDRMHAQEPGAVAGKEGTRDQSRYRDPETGLHVRVLLRRFDELRPGSGCWS